MTSKQAIDGKRESRSAGRTLGSFVARFGALFGLAILVIVLAILSPVFLKPDNLWNLKWFCWLPMVKKLKWEPR